MIFLAFICHLKEEKRREKERERERERGRNNILRSTLILRIFLFIIFFMVCIQKYHRNVFNVMSNVCIDAMTCNDQH